MYHPSGYESINPVDLCLDEYSDINFERLVDKRGEYEDAEEQGLRLRLPWDSIYQIQKLSKLVQDILRAELTTKC